LGKAAGKGNFSSKYEPAYHGKLLFAKKLLQKKETHANNKNIFIHFLNNKYRTEGSQQPKS